MAFEKSRTREMTINCKADGTWDQLENCTWISCTSPLPDKTSNMFITPTLSSKNFPQIGDNLTYNCMAQKYFTFDRGQTSVNITCLTNNAYSGPIGYTTWPTCVSDVTCTAPPTITDTGMKSNYSGTASFKSQFSYSCKDSRFQMFSLPDNQNLGNSLTSECQWNKTWTVDPKGYICKLVFCDSPPVPDAKFGLARIWDGAPIPLGISVQYRCKNSLRLTSNISSNSFELPCLESNNGLFDKNAVWPTCALSTYCTPPPQFPSESGIQLERILPTPKGKVVYIENYFYGNFTVSCPTGFTLLSCGFENSKFTRTPFNRSSYPVNETTCQCFDPSGMACVAWCGAPVQGMEIVNNTFTGNTTVSCPGNKKVVGCHIKDGLDKWKTFYPNPDGQSCNCTDSTGADCIASCAAGITDHEVVKVQGKIIVSAQCPVGKTVLGCGLQPDSGQSPEAWRTIRISNLNNCVCYDYYGTTCYAVCGKFTSGIIVSQARKISDNPTNCGENLDAISGGQLSINISGKIVPVPCTQDGWTVIQSRGQYADVPKDLFDKTWAEYTSGFGTIGKEYWMGLYNIFQMTNSVDYTLRIMMQGFDGITKVANYKTFKLQDTALYKLNISGFSGDTQDSFAYHNGQNFTTKDKDNDLHLNNCAVIYQGAWWHKVCHMVNLNGYNFGHEVSTYGQGIFWLKFTNDTNSLAKVEMALKAHDDPAAITVDNTPPFAPLVSDCSEIYQLGYNLSGVYSIDPSGERNKAQSVQVFCQDGWTYLLKRGKETNDLFQTSSWSNYVSGFGNLSLDFWTGLDPIYRLTNLKSFKLSIFMWDLNDVYKRADYATFKLKNNLTYNLELGDYTSEKSWEVYNTFGFHANSPFSTLDQDNDLDTENNCALKFKSPGWYNGCRLEANLFGKNFQLANVTEPGTGIFWNTFVANTSSIKYIEVAIIPSDFDTNNITSLPNATDLLPAIEAGLSTEYLTQYVYKCSKKGQVMVTSSGDLVEPASTCQWNTSWTSAPSLQPPPTCKWLNCTEAPMPPPDSNLKLKNWNGRQIPIGQSVEYVCIDGTSLNTSVKAAPITATCQDNNQFSLPNPWPMCKDPGNVDDSGTVVLPTDPANLTTVQFPSTTIYYWPNFDLNATTNTSYQVVNGPFQFGEAVKLDKKKSECLEDANFINPDDKCFVDPINCNEGLSLSLFYQVTDPNDAGTKGVKEYILSTGGDDRNPGVGIYFDGVDLCVKLCAGAYTWSLNIAGQRPTDTNWYNIAIRWAMPTYSNATDFQVQKMKNVKTKDFGGLELFVNMKSIGFVLLPDEVGCAMTSPTQTCNASAQATGKPLNPPEVLLGCHKTQNNTVLRNFGSGIYDEVAFWKRRLNETELPYFLGGYKTSLENIAVDVLLQILQSVDMSDSAQANTAISIVNTLVSGPAATLTPTGNVYQTSTAAPPTTAAAVGSGNQVTTTGVTTSTTTKATTTTAKVDLADEIRALIKVMNTLTNANTIPTDVYERSFEIMFNVAKPVGAILSSEGSKYQAGWEAYNENPSDSSPHINREQLENYLVTLMKNRRSNYVRGGTSYSGVRSSNNHIVQLQKMTAQEFVALPAAGETHLILPDWEDGNWTNYMTNTKMGSMPIERVQIPTNIFSGSCKTQNVNLLFSMYNTFPDPGKKNPVNIPANRIVLDSRVMTINITADPLPGRTDLCLPDPKLLLSYPLTLDFMMTSGLQQSVTASRSLKFHDESTETKIKRRYCAVWNEDINGGGAWDTVNTKEIYSDDTVATCFATRLGTFAVVSEIEEAPYVPPDFTWLMVIKMIGYVLSFILLITFAVAVFTSVMLWEMFHIIGMNLSLALFGGNVSMVLSEIQGIRSDRHLCAASGITTNFFYTAAAILLMMESHAIFKATTSGIIGGKTRGYLCIGWGVPFIAVGLNIYMQLLDMGDDPRCMVGWSNLVKWYFFVPVIFAAAYSLVAMLVVICNLQAPALRKKSLVDDHSTLAKGVFALVFVYALCWSWAPVAYINFPGMELPQFYPAFQILNSFMGFFTFICIGLGSRKFRAYAVKTYNSKMEKKH